MEDIIDKRREEWRKELEDALKAKCEGEIKSLHRKLCKNSIYVLHDLTTEEMMNENPDKVLELMKHKLFDVDYEVDSQTILHDAIVFDLDAAIHLIELGASVFKPSYDEEYGYLRPLEDAANRYYEREDYLNRTPLEKAKHIKLMRMIIDRLEKETK